MRRENISNNVIRRLPRYVRKLDDLAAHGVTRISSAELGRQMGLTPSQIRQDFSYFGEFGQQGYGYHVETLRDEIAAILGTRRGFTVVVVGVGNIGHALLENFDFTGNGFTVVGAFDVDPELIGTELRGLRILNGLELPDFLQKNNVDIAVLSVPRGEADTVAKVLAKNGVRAIWNFTNAELALKDPDVVVENIHFSDSLLCLSYYLAEKLDAEENK
jgi:redox-sensing transcriptional repressor